MAHQAILGEQTDHGENFDDNPKLAEKMALLSPSLRWYFFLAGQWFAPVKDIIKRQNHFQRKLFRIAYSIWQGIVVIFMWSFFAYSMGLLSPLRTLKEVNWLCPLTDIKNMAYGLCWIVNHHTGLLFFLMREDRAKQRAKEIKNLIMDTETAFRFFLVLYIAMLLLASSLEIFSVAEKIETVIPPVIIANHTIHCLPASATTSLKTLPFAQESIEAFPHRLAGKRSFPYLLVVMPPGNDSSHTFFHRIPGWTKIEQYKLTTKEIVVAAVLDITQNLVFYAFPLYKMTTLKGCLKSVQATVEDSDYGDQDSNTKIFDTRQDREDFKTYFRNTCTSGIRVLGKEVSFLWTLVLTFLGTFAAAVLNLMFKHIHFET